MGKRWQRTFATEEGTDKLKRDDDGNPIIVGIQDPPILPEFEAKLEAAKAAADDGLIAYYTAEYERERTRVVMMLEDANVGRDDIGPGGPHPGLLVADDVPDDAPTVSDADGETPNPSWSRAALDAHAESIGITDADKLPNKSEVLNSIAAKEA